MTRPRRHAGRAAVAATAMAAALVAVAVGGCGVPIDEEPRVITRTTLEPADDTPTTIAGADAQEVSVYFLRDDRLEAQTYTVPEQPTLGEALGYVLEPPAEGSDPELRTAVPPGTSLRSVEVTDGVATIDLSGEINDVSGQAQKEAFAQVVFTALAFEGVEQVRFLIDGELIDAPTDDGNLGLVAAENYDKPLNPR